MTSFVEREANAEKFRTEQNFKLVQPNLLMDTYTYSLVQPKYVCHLAEANKDILELLIRGYGRMCLGWSGMVMGCAAGCAINPERWRGILDSLRITYARYATHFVWH